jgi:hypothetical protein
VHFLQTCTFVFYYKLLIQRFGQEMLTDLLTDWWHPCGTNPISRTLFSRGDGVAGALLWLKLCLYCSSENKSLMHNQAWWSKGRRNKNKSYLKKFHIKALKNR